MHITTAEYETTLIHWESAGELARSGVGSDGDRSWVGGESLATTKDRAINGNLDLVAEADKLMNSFTLNMETELRSWESSPCGAFAVVPEVLAGFPMPMRRRVISNTDVAPLRIVVDTTSSGGVDASDMRKRGVCILALVMMLKRVRPVELVVLSALGGGANAVNIIPVQSKPLDLALACNALTSVGLCRNLGYASCHRYGDTGGAWCWSMNPQNTSYAVRMKSVLGMSDKDLFIPPLFLFDEAVSNPKVWLQTKLRELGVEITIS